MNDSAYPKDIIRSPQGYSPDVAVDSETSTALDLIDPQRLWQRVKELRYWLIGIVAAMVSLSILYTCLLYTSPSPRD